jgi:hypothetical protein
MKAIVACVLVVCFGVVLLRSDLTPWRIMSKSEIEALATTARRRAVGVALPVPGPTISSGEWMRDPKYRTALEKTTVGGTPENAASREATPPRPLP